MPKCKVCSIQSGHGVPLHKVPRSDLEREEWSKACRTALTPHSFICSKHFAPEDLVTLGRFRHLLPRARPLPPPIPNTHSVTGGTVVQPILANDPICLFKQIGLHPTTDMQVPVRTPIISKVYHTTILRQEDIKKHELINEALFDNEECAKPEDIPVDNGANTTYPLTDSIEIKIEDDAPEYPDGKNILIEPTSFPTTTGIQTDEASEDRINCGFVNVSKNGRDKYFNLHCFYCDAEYPISFWSEFSEHILYTHNDLEEKYNKSDKLISTTTDQNNTKNINEMIATTESATVEELQPIDFINIVNNEINDTNHITLVEHANDSSLKIGLTNYKNTNVKTKRQLKKQQSKKQQSKKRSKKELKPVLRKKNEPHIDHNYSKFDLYGVLDNEDESLDEITFDNTAREVILDLFHYIKGFPNLCRDRKLHPVAYDKELQDLLDIMTMRWNLNLTIVRLRKNWENIKDWYKTLTERREMNGDNNVQHTYSEYYDICEEFLGVGKIFRCDLCKDYVAINARGLELHKYSRHGIGLPPYKCHICNKFFKYIDNMLKDLRRHKTKVEKPVKPVKPVETVLKCFKCNEIFPSANEYKLHLDIHPNGDRPYGCEECGKRFQKKWKLNTHLEKHKIDGYQCELCPAKFKTEFNFRIHIKAHKGIYEYVCEWCGRPFVARNRWLVHVKYEHMGAGVCKICKREYKKPSILYKHLKNLHRPLFGTNEELSIRGPRKGHGRGGRGKRKDGICLNARKYEYIIDPETKRRRAKCPKCDKTFMTGGNALRHALKEHNFDARILPRGAWQRTVKSNLSNNVSASVTNDATIAAVDTITEHVVTKMEDCNSNDAAGVDACLANDDTNKTKPVCVGVAFKGNEIQAVKNETGTAFEKLVDEVTSHGTCSTQHAINFVDDMCDQLSTDKTVAPLMVALTHSASDEFEFILNANGEIIKFPD